MRGYNKIDLAWAAGIFDGEGCLSIHSNPGNELLKYLQADMAMTDEDLVRRFHSVVGVGTVNLRKPPTDGWGKLPLWVWRANSFEYAQAVVAMLWPHLGQRRRARAVEALNIVRESQAHRKTMRRGTECSEIDCERPVLARGLCHSHYSRVRYSERSDTPCVIDGCTRRPNGTRGRCRAHTEEAKRLVG